MARKTDDAHMLVVLGMAALGATLGALTAKKRSGNRADMAQYAAGYGIAFALVGLVISLILVRLVA
ncbi:MULTISPECIES: hypothetical protein [unclassified Ruegeria]|uniref:hypothetical protein n=1 Tax=unclassified Ruegeria TaxID=2625375 RepID=UPI001490AA73|nr:MULTISPECIES: hypothetical protein [unclassified Ruegeria]NOC44391.1 hypothetical protein [Ruegeria sp. HKCCD7559]NOD83119.1 hypothetical protein [Ruegeria sp. HKCCD6119]